MAKAAFVYSDAYLGYRFSRAHPLQQVRLQMNYQLLEAYSVFSDGRVDLVTPVPATEADLLRVHTPQYVDALRTLSAGQDHPYRIDAGFGPGDNPAFPGMYEATLLYVGATKDAVGRVISGNDKHAFNSSGGLHHAMPGRAAGFCLANDCALAAKWLTDAGHKVAYIDIDAHHGDGVQDIFYGDPSVLTISLHESPETLFPRVTGYVDEIGTGAGAGFNVNIPMLAGSTDEHYQFAFAAIVNPIIAAFEPTAIVLQVGADGHYDDPLAHLQLTSHGWLAMITQVLAYNLPVIALGGGGYNLTTVARLWTLLTGNLSGIELADSTPEPFAQQSGIAHLHDSTSPNLIASRTAECWVNVKDVASRLRTTVFPIHSIV